MIQPQPFKYICPKCGYTRMFNPKSDVLGGADSNMVSTCPKCGTEMDKTELSIKDKLFK